MFDYILGLSWGTIIGFAIAVPVGPVGIICIQRTIVKGKKSGLITGLGAATADTLLASIGAFSISIVFIFIREYILYFEIIGAIILILLGIFSFISKPKVKAEKDITVLDHIEEFVSSLILTITNPLSAFSLFIAFGAVSSHIKISIGFSIVFILGVFIGSCIWWIILTSITKRITHKMNSARIHFINKCFAATTIIIGFIILLRVLFKLF